MVRRAGGVKGRDIESSVQTQGGNRPSRDRGHGSRPDRGSSVKSLTLEFC